MILFTRVVSILTVVVVTSNCHDLPPCSPTPTSLSSLSSIISLSKFSYSESYSESEWIYIGSLMVVDVESI